MQVQRLKGDIEEIELFGQVSQTGKGFSAGYYISFMLGTFYFSEGEEEERDAFLKEKEIFDEDCSSWEDLYEEDDDSFYYSEWNPEEDLDSAFDKDGTPYEYDETKKMFIEQ
tara:strand:+ start:417 stop:752 length:336 start_codon:yes stop_codon:yes gene_type:complete